MRSAGTRHAHGRSAGRRVHPVVIALLAVVGLAAGAGGAALLSGTVDSPAGSLPAASLPASSASTGSPPEVTPSAAPTPAPTPTPTTPPDGRTAADVAAGLLSLDVPTSASGTLVVVPGNVTAPGPGKVRKVRVEVEAGLPVDPTIFADFVMTTLNDPRGWGAGGTMSFARTDGDADLRVVLASPTKVDEMCVPLKTGGVTSCGRNGHAALNYMRWVQGTPEFADNMLTYRQYVVSHEVGHLLGHPHEKCPGAGQVAPVMQQQTLGVAPCLPNAWPHP